MVKFSLVLLCIYSHSTLAIASAGDMSMIFASSTCWTWIWYERQALACICMIFHPHDPLSNAKEMCTEETENGGWMELCPIPSDQTPLLFYSPLLHFSDPLRVVRSGNDQFHCWR